MKIKLGRCGKAEVYFDATRAYNRHVTILGKSGAGKSVLAQKLLLELVRDQEPMDKNTKKIGG